MVATTSLPCPKKDGQQSVNDCCPCIGVNPGAVWWRQHIIERSATFRGKKACISSATKTKNRASMELRRNVNDVSTECEWSPLATGPVSQVGSGYASSQNSTEATGLTTRKTWTIGKGPVLPPKTGHFKFTILPTIKHFSSDRIMTWSVCTLCSFSRSFTSCCQICDQTNICWVAIDNPPISRKISHYFTAIQQILVWSQIWLRAVNKRLDLHTLNADYVMIWSEVKYLIGGKVGGTVKVESRSGYNPLNKPRVYIPSRVETCQVKAGWVCARVWIWTESNCWTKPVPRVGFMDPLLILSIIKVHVTWIFQPLCIDS